MVKSLRWRLQFWHAVILIAALALFGAAFFRQLRYTTLNEIDSALLAHARMVESDLRESAATIDDLNKAETFAEINVQLPPSRSRNGRRNDKRADDRPPRRPNDRRGRDNRRRPPRPRQPMYLAVLNPSQQIVFSQSTSLTDATTVTWRALRSPVEYRDVDDRREVLLKGPHDSLIVVGRNVDVERKNLATVLLSLLGIGAAVSLLGVFGGWWLAKKIIDPVKQISETAEKITARNLNERIDHSQMDHELQGLGNTLNSMLDRLESAFQQQSQFTADASHELRTPIAVLKSHTELALSRARSNEELVQTIQTCQNATQRMDSLVSGLLSLARADAGQLELNCSSFDLNELSSEMVEMFEPLAAENGVRLELVGKQAECYADRARIGRVISNLLHNAIAYNKKEGDVVLETEATAESVILRVVDSGIGIQQQELPMLFNRFYRADQSRTRVGGDQSAGSGLGLAICKKLVDAHGGSIEVESELGKGSTFIVKLPKQQV